MSGSGTEPYRTSSGMSMLLGNASLPIRDVVRNFDKFTVSFVNSLYYWLMQFSDDASIRGDFSMVAKGSTSLIAKEVRANEIDVFCSTLTPGQQLWIDDEKLLREKMAARRIGCGQRTIHEVDVGQLVAGLEPHFERPEQLGDRQTLR